MKNFFDAVESGFGRTKALLWPFRKNVWLKLMVLYLLTGGCSGFSGNGFPSFPSNKKSEPAKGEVTTPPGEAASPTQTLKPDMKKNLETVKIFIKENKSAFFWMGGFLASLGLFFLLLFIWISSRAQMIILRSLSTGAVQVRQYWRETKELGDSLFRLNAVLTVAVLLFLSGAGVFAFQSYQGVAKEDLWVYLLTALGFSLGFIILFSLLIWTVNSFLPVVMYGKNTKSAAGLKEIFQWAQENFFRGLGIVFLYWIFSIAVIIAYAFVALFLVLILAIPAAIVGILLVLVSKILGIIFGLLMWLAAIFVTLLLLTVPMQTFLTYIRMELVGRECKDLPQPLTNS